MPPPPDVRPETLAADLVRAETRDAAVARIDRALHDALGRAQGDRDAPAVRALLDAVVPPLVAAHRSGTLDEDHRASALWSLVASRDLRAEPVVRDTLVLCEHRDCRPEELELAVEYLAATPSVRAGEALLAAHLAQPELGPGLHAEIELLLRREVRPSWLPSLARELGRNGGSAGHTPRARLVLALLGELGSPDAARVIVEGVSDWSLEASAAGARLGEVGPRAAPLALELLRSKDTARALAGAVALAVIGRQPDRAAVRTALASAAPRELPWLVDALTAEPLDEADRRAVVTAFTRVGNAEETFGEGCPAAARVRTAEILGDAMDPTLVPLLLSLRGRVRTVRGEVPEAARIVKSALVVAAARSMARDQVELVRVAAAEDGTRADRADVEAAAELVTVCGDDPACYIARVVDTPKGSGSPDDDPTAFAAWKAVSMLGVLRRPDRAGDLVARLGVAPPIVRWASARALGKLFPAGDATLAASLGPVVPEPSDGPDARRRLTVGTRCLEDPDGRLRELARALRARAR